MQNFDVVMFGDFYLDKDIIRFETNSDESIKLHFGGMLDFEIEKLISRQGNQNTNRNTRWAFGVFKDWRQEKNKSVQLEFAIPELLTMDVSTISCSLTCFECDARKKDGSEYPPSRYIIKSVNY